MDRHQSFVLTQILSKYLKNGFDDNTNDLIQSCAEEIALEDWLPYIIEITYHIGYTNSILSDNISEYTYKQMKKMIVDNLYKRLSGGLL